MAEKQNLEKFGHYTLLQPIAIGSVSEIFLAHTADRPEPEQIVVIKRILEQARDNVELVKMFVDEEAMLARLDHPNIVRALDFGKASGRYFIALEHVWGESLTNLGLFGMQRKIPCPRDAALHIAAEVASGLAHAHEATDAQGQPNPVIHRDVTFGNVVVSYEGEVKILDFGIAKSDGRLARTRVGLVKGTLAYLAPEQLKGRAIDPRTDLYQLGVLLYKLLVGKEPFCAASEGAFMEAIIGGRLRRPSELVPGFPDALETLLLRMLAVDPSDRFASARELKHTLRGLLPASFGSGSERLKSLLQQLTGDRFARQQVLVQDALGGLEIDPRAGELFRRRGDDEEPTDLSVESSLPQPPEGPPQEAATTAFDEMPWATAELLVADAAPEPAPEPTRPEPARKPMARQTLENPVPRTAIQRTLDRGLALVDGLGHDLGRRGREAWSHLRRAWIHLRKVWSHLGERRVLTSTFARLYRSQAIPWARRVATIAGASLHGLTGLLGRMVARLRSRHLPSLIGLAAGILGGALLLGLWLIPGADPITRIDAGGAAAVLEELTAIKDDARTPADELIRGHALVAMEKPEEALLAYRQAVAGGAVDARLQTWLIARLDREEYSAIMDILTGWPGKEVDSTLLAMTENDRWRVRHHALKVLTRRGADSPVDRQAFAIKDLLGGNSCESRASGLEMLKRHGHDTAAIAAIDQARKRLPDNVCMVFKFASAEGAIRRRLGK